MEKRKSQNSILFVATLGVYLGLMIAGATPQVLANAATTRSFDIKDEIEFQDKLDRDPDTLADETRLRQEAAQGRRCCTITSINGRQRLDRWQSVASRNRHAS